MPGITDTAGVSPAAGISPGAGIALLAGIAGDIGGNPIPGLSPAAYYKFNTGITSLATLVSQWDDQSGNGKHLVQAVALNQPVVQGDGSILFDGTLQFLKVASIALNQPLTIYARLKQISWTANDIIIDGGTNSIGLRQKIGGASPQIELSTATGLNTATNGDLALGAYASVAFESNGASSLIQVGSNAATTGDVGGNNGTSLTLAANSSGVANFANVQVKELAAFAAAHDAATRARVIAYLNTL